MVLSSSDSIGIKKDTLDLILPAKGNIRALILTEKQFDHMRLLLGRKSELEEARKPRQLVLF
ncbi:hypothetical protein BKH42_04130 [Helicobacter sp. 13S00482-2]|nr:hypothetical protein BKH42_04130 [Helicobacter sp. 13S00482-2]